MGEQVNKIIICRLDSTGKYAVRKTEEGGSKPMRDQSQPAE